MAGLRPDGFHELETIFHGVSLADQVSIETVATGSTDASLVEVEFASGDGFVGDLPASIESTATDAARALIDAGSSVRGALIRIVKRIPIGAGMGGGSSDAAAVLIGLNELWDVGLDKDRLKDVGAGIGSDVPYCLTGGTALAMSRGEDLQPLPAPATMQFVLGISDSPLLTRDVYAAYDDLDPSDAPGSAPMVLALADGDVAEVATLLHNDLERASFRLRPELAAAKQLMVDSGALGSAMAGSGPTIFGIAPDRSAAERLADLVRGRFDRVEVVETALRCVERIRPDPD